MHAQESSIASVSSMIEFLNANGPASFRETATGLVKLILVMPATANELVLMETTINIYNCGGHTGLYKFHSLHSHNNNMVLLSRHSADTSPFFSIVWYSLSIIPVL